MRVGRPSVPRGKAKLSSSRNSERDHWPSTLSAVQWVLSGWITRRGLNGSDRQSAPPDRRHDLCRAGEVDSASSVNPLCPACVEVGLYIATELVIAVRPDGILVLKTRPFPGRLSLTGPLHHLADLVHRSEQGFARIIELDPWRAIIRFTEENCLNPVMPPYRNGFVSPPSRRHRCRSFAASSREWVKSPDRSQL